MSKFYSENGEDRWIEENLKPGAGTFCEVGALDGIQSANTLHFEEIGWTGILVEPNPEMAALCQRNRKAHVWCCAAGLETHGRFMLNVEKPGWSGFKSMGVPIMVLVRHLDWLLGYKAPDLLSIDTEGTELDVWESIGTLRPSIVIIEYSTQGLPDNSAAILECMTLDGYKEVHRTKSNLIFSRA